MTATLTARQQAALTAVCEALLPAVPRDHGVDSSLAAGATVARTSARVAELIATLPDERNRRRLAILLSALGSPLVNLLLSGQPGSITALDRARAEALLRTWAHSRIPLRRVGFRALARLTYVAYYCWPLEDRSHPAWRVVGYPGPLPMPTSTAAPLMTTDVTRDTTLECDVVVVGSGAGGGVAAGVLATAGRSVVVLEKGANLDPRALTQVEGEMLRALYLDGGLLTTASGAMSVLAGSCVGGGTAINYTTSLPLPEAVRTEWDRLSELRLFSSARFAESLDRVSARLGLSTRWTTPGMRDVLLERGCRRLGWHADAMPRNVTDCHEGLECGYCGYGCRHGAKNSTDRTYLADAVAAGARVVPRARAERILSEGGRVAGVVATVTRPDGGTCRLTVRARVVVAACGAIRTPALLARCGIGSGALGRGLRLHPATALIGIFPERVEPWSGALQTRYSNQFADIRAGYGARFETVPMHFALPASGFGWESSQCHSEDMARLSHTSIIGVLLRDRDAGRVVVTRAGRSRVRYDVSDYDQRHMREALTGAARVLAAAGATEIVSLHSPPVRVRPQGRRWLEQLVAAMDARGYAASRMSYVTFHQMASAPMGRDPRRSVVDERGEAHRLAGLYVADASVFPTSSGVNPMLTIMAIADHVARGIAQA